MRKAAAARKEDDDDEAYGGRHEPNRISPYDHTNSTACFSGVPHQMWVQAKVQSQFKRVLDSTQVGLSPS